MKREINNLKKTLYLNPSLDEAIQKIADENECSFQKTLRYLLSKGIEYYEGGHNNESYIKNY